MAGTTAAKLFGEGAFIILKKGDRALRLVCPSKDFLLHRIAQIRRGLVRAAGKRFYNDKHVKGTHTARELRKLIGEEESLFAKMIEEYRPHVLNDQLKGHLEIPFGKRPTINFVGHKLEGESGVLGTSANTGDRILLFPFNLLQEIRNQLARIYEENHILPENPFAFLPRTQY